jgi:uncharacterized protein YegJ (DUF2314 family)
MRRSCRTMLVIAAALSLPLGEAAAQTTLEKANRDEVFNIPRGDPDMAAAVRQARATLPDFFALAQSPKPSMNGFSVKVGAPYGTNNTEYLWIAPFERRGDKYVGRLNNTPRHVTHIKHGDVVSFGENEIVDWHYVEDGKMKGNFTTCVLMRREPRQQAEAFIKQRSLDCKL